jgi:endoglucanase
MPKPLLRLVLLALLALLLVPASAAAASVSFSSDAFTVRKGEGDAVVTLVRSDARGAAQVRYGAWHVTAQPGIDYQPVGGRVDFADGQSQASFTVPILNDGYAKGPVTVRLGLYGAYPLDLGTPSQAILTILDPATGAAARDPRNPLGLATPPPGSNPLLGARFFVDRQWGLASVVAHQVRHAKPAAAGMLEAIAGQPEAHRFGHWDPDPRQAVGRFLSRAHAADPGAVPLVETYRLRHVRCGGVSDSPADVASFERWYQQFAQGIGNAPVVVFVEIDALITTGCLSHHGLAVRIGELRTALADLAAQPHTVVYLDAGAADAFSAARTASLLRRIGISGIEGFFLNATHFDWTSSEIRYGNAIVRRLGGQPHFVVNTAVNGRGPLHPRNRVKSGNEVLCNPRGRGLGPRPTANVPARYRNLDGFFWIGNPGRSGGTCGIGDPGTGQFFLDYALMLIRNADYRMR